MRCFGCRFDENIANNVRIAYCAVLNAVRGQDHFGEGPGPPFWRLWGHFGTPWPAPGATRAPFLLIGVHLYFQVRFPSNSGSQGDPKSEVGSMGAAPLATWENSIWPLWEGFPLED